jgi:hypothetical protein
MHYWPGALQLHWPGEQQQGDYAKHTDDAGDAEPSRIFLEDPDIVPTGLGSLHPKAIHRCADTALTSSCASMSGIFRRQFAAKIPGPECGQLW